MTVFQLSLEEVAFAMGYLGGAKVAAGYLTAITGKLSSDELAGRMTAASHSLLARDLLVLDAATARASMEQELQQAIAALMTGENSLRVSATTDGLDNVVTFFLDGSRPVRHQLIQEVVTRLILMADMEAVALDIVRLLCPEGLPEQTSAARIGVMPVAVLQQARSQAMIASVAQLISLLQGALPLETAVRLASDFSDPQATWGAVLRLKAGTGGVLEANQGCFTVSLPEHGWLFDMATDPAQAEVFALSVRTVQQAALRLATSLTSTPQSTQSAQQDHYEAGLSPLRTHFA